MSGLQLALCDRALAPGGTVPEWVHLLPAGEIEGRDGRRYSLPDPAGLVLAFQAGGIDLPVDYEHQTERPEATLHGPVPAAGWIKALRADDQGIWGRVEWTATARELIAAKGYRFVSPAFLHDRTGAIQRLKGAGLVHNPNLHLTALASQETPMAPKDRMTEDAAPARVAQRVLAEIARLLKLPSDTEPQELLDRLAEALTAPPDPKEYMPMKAVQSMLDARREERGALSEERAKAKVDDAFRKGYLTTPMKEWALALCRSDEAAFDSFLAQGPVFGHLLKPATGARALPVSAAEPSAHDLETAIAAQLGIAPERLRGA